MAAEFRNDPVFTDGDDVYFIPADKGATALLYNTEEVSAADAESLQIFTDPAYAGRTSLPDNVDDSFALAYLATGTTDWTQATQEDFERAAEWLRDAHENARTYWTDGAELNQLMATGEVTVAWSWNESFVGLADEGHPVAFNREAEEGSSQWFCGFVNLVDGPGSEARRMTSSRPGCSRPRPNTWSTPGATPMPTPRPWPASTQRRWPRSAWASPMRRCWPSGPWTSSCASR